MLEFGLYVEDVPRAVEFYKDLFGFPLLVSDNRMAAPDVEGSQVLLLFKRGASSVPVTTKGGVLPGHDGHGTSHLAFAISADDLVQWERWLDHHQVTVESEVRWEEGGRSIYFRDPDGHLLELVTPGVWEDLLSVRARARFEPLDAPRSTEEVGQPPSRVRPQPSLRAKSDQCGPDFDCTVTLEIRERG